MGGCWKVSIIGDVTKFYLNSAEIWRAFQLQFVARPIEITLFCCYGGDKSLNLKIVGNKNRKDFDVEIFKSFLIWHLKKKLDHNKV